MRMHVKKYRSRKTKLKIIIIFIIIIISFFLILLNRVGSNLSSYYIDYSKRHAIHIIDTSLNKAVTNDVMEEFKKTELFLITKNKNDEIETIDYNSVLVNSLLNKISTNLYNTLKKEEKSSDASFYIPLLASSKNPLLTDKGPKIPVRLELIGSVISEINTTVKECGINSSLIEMSVHVEVTEKVVLPISSDEIKVKNNIPISYKIISGKVPTYYGGSYVKNSPIWTLPVE